MNNRKPTTPGIAVVIAAGALLLMVLIPAWFYLPERHDTVARAGLTPEERRELLEEKEARVQSELGEYGWIDRDAGRIRLPIERAIDLAVEEIDARGTVAVEDFDDSEAEETEAPGEDEPEEADGADDNEQTQG